MMNYTGRKFPLHIESSSSGEDRRVTAVITEVVGNTIHYTHDRIIEGHRVSCNYTMNVGQLEKLDSGLIDEVTTSYW